MRTQSPRGTARERLLDAADELFYLGGISATGVDDVLARAEVSVATLYAHFGSKDGLLEASLQRRLDTWKLCWDDAIADADSDSGRLLAVFDALVLFRERQRNSRWCAFLSTAVEVPPSKAGVAELVKADTALLTERLQVLSEPIAGPDADRLAAAILLIYNGTLASFLRGSPEDPIAHARDAASLVVGTYVH